MSAPVLSFENAQARRLRVGYLRLRVKPEQQSCGPVQGAWWPRTDQLHTELPQLLAAVAPRVGSVVRVIYDETAWAPSSARMEFRGRSVVLEGSYDASINTLSVIGERSRRLDLLVVPPYTNPSRAYAAVMTASEPDNDWTPDELLGIGPQEAQDRQIALVAQQRWESEGGALRRPNDRTVGGVAVGGIHEVRRAQ
jgi:hypothetical protein